MRIKHKKSKWQRKAIEVWTEKQFTNWLVQHNQNGQEFQSSFNLYIESVETKREATTGCVWHLSNVKQLRPFALLRHVYMQQCILLSTEILSIVFRDIASHPPALQAFNSKVSS
jgi:hypothetical protein